MTQDDDKLTLIGVAENEIEANVWRDALAQEGIEAFVKADNPLSALGGPAGLGSFKVFVLGRDEKRARWLLGEQTAAE